MTIAELIAELAKFNPETRVFKDGHPDGGGLDEVDGVNDEEWVKDCGYYCSYAGRFDCADEGDDGAVLGIRLY